MVLQFINHFKVAFPDMDIPYLGGIWNLKVMEVSGPFRIEEYNGNESVQEVYEDWIDPR